MRRLVRAPALHFLVLGVLILGARRWWTAGDQPDAGRRIVVGDADVARLREAWREEHGAPPGPAAGAALVRDAVDEEVLYREALAAGFDRTDASVRERLVRLGDFLGEDPARDRAELERDARRLGLAESDVVVRRHLVQMMRLATTQPAPADVPTDAELAEYLRTHAADFATPGRVRLTHVYLGRDRRGGALARDAAALLADLRRRDVAPADAVAMGDPFIGGADVGPATVDEVARVFGPAFARALADVPARTWTGPVASPYGLHLVWVHERVPAAVPPLADVRGQLALRLLRERGAARAAERMRLLRARWQIDVASP